MHKRMNITKWLHKNVKDWATLSSDELDVQVRKLWNDGEFHNLVGSSVQGEQVKIGDHYYQEVVTESTTSGKSYGISTHAQTHVGHVGLPTSTDEPVDMGEFKVTIKRTHIFGLEPKPVKRKTHFKPVATTVAAWSMIEERLDTDA